MTHRARTLLSAVIMTASAAFAHAQEFPSRTVKMVAPFPAGGGTDLNVRRLAERLTKLWGQPVVVENIGGAAGGLAAAAVARAKPDGYTLFFVTHPVIAINPALYDKLAYDPDKDFAPVLQVSETPSVLLTHPALQVTKVSELIALAKARPGALHFGSGGIGTTMQLGGELFKAAAGIELTHIPYKGAAPALTAMMSQEIQLVFDSSSSAIGQVRGGRVRAIAIASLSRLPALADVPTFDENGLRGFTSTLAHGLLAPAATPAAAINAINRDVNATLKEPDYRKMMNELGVSLVGGSAGDFRLFLAIERNKWAALIQKLGIKGEG